MHLASLADRNIFAGYEMFVREMVAGLVSQMKIVVIVEAPGASGVVG
jgi:TfoX/Sxy family transcriptional regulator of competence genes